MAYYKIVLLMYCLKCLVFKKSSYKFKLRKLYFYIYINMISRNLKTILYINAIITKIV